MIVTIGSLGVVVLTLAIIWIQSYLLEEFFNGSISLEKAEKIQDEME